jgi:hypothetical protein
MDALAGGYSRGSGPSSHPYTLHRPRRRLSRHSVWWIAIGAAAAVVLILLALILRGYLVIPSVSPAQVTITDVVWKIQEGNNSFGLGWFGPSTVDATNGLPIEVKSGGTFTVVLVLTSFDVANHTIHTVLASSPFTVAYTSPSLPAVVLSGEDDFALSVKVGAPSVTSDTSYQLVLTIDALG